MILVEELDKIQDLPAALTCEVLCKCLQLVKHYVLDVIVCKHGVD